MDFIKPIVMGVLNATPDSFSDGGKYTKIQIAINRCLEMIDEGAKIIDIGGESSRPGADPLPEKLELQRVVPLIEQVSKRTKIPISIDTYKPAVADASIQAGAKIINDITGLANPEMVKVASKHKCPVIIMHMQNNPKTMQKKVAYKNVIEEIITFFKKQITIAKNNNIEQLILDPGIGFGKKLEHNLLIIKHIQKFKDLGYPILIGASRKSFIGTITNKESNERLGGSIASASISIYNGANIIRAHDIKETVNAIQIANAIREA